MTSVVGAPYRKTRHSGGRRRNADLPPRASRPRSPSRSCRTAGACRSIPRSPTWRSLSGEFTYGLPGSAYENRGCRGSSATAESQHFSLVEIHEDYCAYTGYMYRG